MGGGWSTLLPQPQGQCLNSVDFVDTSTGWAVGNAGTILRSDDGGRTWTSQPAPTAFDVQAVSFINDQLGWAIASPGALPVAQSLVVLHTADGGGHWTKTATIAGAAALSMSFGSPSVGLITAQGPQGGLYRTGDGGLTWTLVSGVTGWYQSVRMVDSLHGWVVGTYSGPNGAAAPAILHTTDGGLTWNGQNPGFTSGSLDCLSAPDQNTAIACGATNAGGRVVLRTTDAGKTWTDISIGYSDNGWSVAFADADHGWVGGWNLQDATEAGRVWCTADGGKTWTEQSSFPRSLLRSMDAVDASHAWICADRQVGTVWSTTNGGATWSSDAGATLTSPIIGLRFRTPQLGWVVTEPISETGTDSAAVYDTTDGGASWTTVDIAQTIFPAYAASGVALSFGDDRSGWLVGGGVGGMPACIIHTSDGGHNWSAQTPGPASWSGRLTAVCALDGDTAWAVGTAGHVLRTVDGGS